MAYDVVVGKSSKVKDTPDIVASIEFSALKHITSLAQKCDCVFLNSLSNLFVDATFTPDDIARAIQALNPLLLHTLTTDDRKMLYKLLAVLGYAWAKQQRLFGVAD